MSLDCKFGYPGSRQMRGGDRSRSCQISFFEAFFDFENQKKIFTILALLRYAFITDG